MKINYWLIFLIILFIIILCFNYKSKESNQKKPKIAICTWYNDGIKKYADIARDINQKYCDLHGYDFIVDHTRRLPERKNLAWECIPLVLDIVKKNQYDYVIWIDADAVFRLNNNFDLLESYLNDNKDKDFIFSADVPGYDIINLGFFIVKSNSSSEKILSESLKSDFEECKIFNKWPAEQGCMIKIHKEYIKKNGDILPIGELQSLHTINKMIDKEYDDSLILHLAGVSNEDRYEIFKNLKEKEYSKYFK